VRGFGFARIARIPGLARNFVLTHPAENADNNSELWEEVP